MKKTLTILGALALMSFAAERFINLKFSELQLNYHWKNLENVKKSFNPSFDDPIAEMLPGGFSLNRKIHAPGPGERLNHVCV